jgi:integrase
VAFDGQGSTWPPLANYGAGLHRPAGCGRTGRAIVGLQAAAVATEPGNRIEAPILSTFFEFWHHNNQVLRVLARKERTFEREQLMMSRVFKKNFTDKNGNRAQTTNYTVEFKDHHEKKRRITAFSDKASSEELRNRIEKLVRYRYLGETPDPTLADWLENLSDPLKNRLAELDLLDARRLAASQSLETHLCDFYAALIEKGTEKRDAKQKYRRAQKIVDGCGVRKWSELKPGLVRQYLHNLREPQSKNQNREKPKKGISPQTYNHYLQAIKQFCRWMVSDGRASESPIAHLEGLNPRTDRRHDRRALTAEELRWLIDVTQKAESQRYMTGPQRAVLYWLAAETGLRRAEIESLRVSSFELESNPPKVTVAASYSKRRREDEVTLREEVAQAVAAQVEGKPANAAAFNMPPRDKNARVFKADLDEARQQWIKAADTAEERERRQRSYFLSYTDQTDRVADFHALRHTFITNLASGGVHPKTAQTLARHSTVTLTMDRYAHSDGAAEQAALQALPQVGQVLARPQQPDPAAQASGDKSGGDDESHDSRSDAEQTPAGESADPQRDYKSAPEADAPDAAGTGGDHWAQTELEAELCWALCGARNLGEDEGKGEYMRIGEPANQATHKKCNCGQNPQLHDVDRRGRDSKTRFRKISVDVRFKKGVIKKFKAQFKALRRHRILSDCWSVPAGLEPGFPE